MKNSTFKNWRFATDMMMCDYILSEDHEHSMARSELKVIQSAINRLMQKLKGEGNIEAWVQSKITKAADYIDTAADYLNSDETETKQIDEISYNYSLPSGFAGSGKVVAGLTKKRDDGSKYTTAGTVQKVLGVKIPGSFQSDLGLSGDRKLYQSDVNRHNKNAPLTSQIKSNASGITPDKKPVSVKPVTTTPTSTATLTSTPPTTASGGMQKALKDVPFLGGVANIAKKYDDRVNYRNQPPEIRKQMGLQNSYDLKGEVVVEEQKDKSCWDGYKQVGMKKKGKKMVPNCVPEETEIQEESKSGDDNLGDWFRKSSGTNPKTGKKVPGWVQLGGEFAGAPCAKQPGQTTKPKCGSSKMAAEMSPEEEERAAERKRREDPNPDRKGKAINVATEEYVEEDACKTKVKSRYKVWPSAYASGALVKCRKVGAANWGTKSESTNSLDGDWHTPIRERADRYCPKCEKLERRSECKYGSRYWDMFSLPAEIISSKKDYNITMPYPANEETNIDENYLRIQSRGTTYTILLNWRGKYITSQMFFQQFTRPTKAEVTREVRKVYPNAIVLAFNPSANDPTKPLLFTGEPNGPKKY